MVSESGKPPPKPLARHPRRRAAYPEVYALLWLTRRCEANIAEFLTSWGVPAGSVQRGMHLTVYHARRLLPGLPDDRRTQRVSIDLNVSETRFMVLAPGGENPRPELEPAKRSVGIRLTKRNIAVERIQELRSAMCALETPETIGRRKPSTAWTSCFGSRHYQPHVKLLHPGSEIDRDLTDLGAAFRMCFSMLEFGKYEVTSRGPRVRSTSSGRGSATS